MSLHEGSLFCRHSEAAAAGEDCGSVRETEADGEGGGWRGHSDDDRGRGRARHSGRRSQRGRRREEAAQQQEPRTTRKAESAPKKRVTYKAVARTSTSELEVTDQESDTEARLVARADDLGSRRGRVEEHD